MPAGQYNLIVSHPGYLRAQYGQRGPNGAASPVTIAASQPVNGVRIALMRAGAIAGHVFDENGKPAVNAQLHAWKISFKDGWRLATPVVSQMTNDLGEYRLWGLLPGEYYVSAQVEPLVHIRSPASASMAPLAPGATILSPGAGMFSAIPDPAFPRPGPRTEWSPVYFGGATDEYAATPVHVRPGSDLNGIDIIAKRLKSANVTGVVMGPDGQPFAPPPRTPPGGRGQASTPVILTGPTGERIEVTGLPPQVVGASVVVTPLANPMFHAAPAITVLGGVMTIAPVAPIRSAAMGLFRLGALPPGGYVLTAIADDPQGRRLAGQTTINMQGADPGNVTIAMSPTWELQGRITIQDGPAGNSPDLTSLSVRAANTMTALADAMTATPSASGAFTLRNLSRGNFALTVPPISNLIGPAPKSGVPPGWQNAYVKSAHLGNVDVLGNGLRLDNPSDVPLEIVIGRNGGSVRGGSFATPTALLCRASPPFSSRIRDEADGSTSTAVRRLTPPAITGSMASRPDLTSCSPGRMWSFTRGTTRRFCGSMKTLANLFQSPKDRRRPSI